jgi:3-hydroxyacyl-CoA dehydrogenase/enoyl-CoA hydratase/3-hydroxybutyryl-CoA epimerase/enoyl-CoA isomerase
VSSLSPELQQVFRQHADKALPVRKAAVLGAGIMGGGITSAAHGVPVVMKDIAQAQLDLGLTEAKRQLSRQLKKETITQEQADQILASTEPTLEYTAFDQCDAVIEAVVENLGLKHRVLDEVETVVNEKAIIASNTSSLRIDDIGAHSLCRQPRRQGDPGAV